MDPILLVGPRGLWLRCRVARTRRERIRGLRGLDRLEPGRALLIPRASSVHTIGMRFAILVARLDRDLRVVDVRVLAPRRVLLPKRGARFVLEATPDADVRLGDRLVPQPEGSGEDRADGPGHRGRGHGEDGNDPEASGSHPRRERHRLPA